MWKYIRLCKQPTKPKISLNTYLLDESALNSYSLTDFCDLQQLFKCLSEAHNLFMDHIINNCEVYPLFLSLFIGLQIEPNQSGPHSILL